LDKAAVKRISKSIFKTIFDWLDSFTHIKPSKELLEQPFIPNINPVLIEDIQTLFATALLMGMDHATRKINTADTEIPPLPFEEAVSFMKGRVPMTKTEWNELEPKLRFRAFTVARLAQCDFIETVRGRLINAMEKGEGFTSTWNDIKAVTEADSAFQFRPGYWENVFRTNTQTAYTAGKLMQYRNNPPPAWNLLIVDDSRTSDICRGLIHSGKQSLAMLSNHPFWEKFGFPPYHFQCRTGLQAVYSSQIGTDIQVENPTMKSIGRHFKPMEGFGGNPLEKESWWMMTENMAKRAAQYNIFNDVEKFAKDNGLFNFSMNLVKGTDLVQLKGTNYAAIKAGKADPKPHEVMAAKVLEDNNHTVYFTPENKVFKNYDAIIDGRLGEFKNLESFNKIKVRLNEADTQRASIVCMTLPTENHTLKEAVSIIEDWFKTSQHPIKYVDTVHLIWNGRIKTIKK